MKTLTIALSLSLLFLFSGSATAEPTDSVRWLMNEPASLLDIAMIRLRIANETQWTPNLLKRLEGKGFAPKPIYAGSAVYDFDENRIVITAAIVGVPSEEACADALSEYLNIIVPGRREATDLILGSFFAHINYDARSRPKNLSSEITKLLEFTIGIYDKLDPDKRVIFCKSTVEKTSPSYQKFGF